jgi:hypothetical protein
MQDNQLNAKYARHVHQQASRAWATLLEHDEGFTVGDEATPPVAAAKAQGWEVVLQGNVVLARDDRQLFAVGPKGSRAWAVPLGSIAGEGAEG